MEASDMHRVRIEKKQEDERGTVKKQTNKQKKKKKRRQKERASTRVCVCVREREREMIIHQFPRRQTLSWTQQRPNSSSQLSSCRSPFKRERERV